MISVQTMLDYLRASHRYLLDFDARQLQCRGATARIQEERCALDDGLRGGQHGQHHLLAVAEHVVGGTHTESHIRNGVGHDPIDGERIHALCGKLLVKLAGSITTR